MSLSIRKSSLCSWKRLEALSTSPVRGGRGGEFYYSIAPLKLQRQVELLVVALLCSSLASVQHTNKHVSVQEYALCVLSF